MELVGVFMICFSTKPLAILFVISIKPETKYRFHTGVILLFYIFQNIAARKVVYFLAVFLYIISGP